jgi:hypothetical protein
MKVKKLKHSSIMENSNNNNNNNNNNFHHLKKNCQENSPGFLTVSFLLMPHDVGFTPRW